MLPWVRLLALSAAAVTVLLHVGPSAAQNLTCYTCDTNALTGADTTDCLVVSANTSTSFGCAACTTTAVTSTATGVTAYARACSAASTATTPTCSGITATTTHTSICTCVTDFCNAALFSALGTISCYSCSSVPYIDNGCGAVLNPYSVYVTKVQGCTACSKTSSSNAAGTQYTRACVQYQTTGDTCTGTPALAACTTECTINLCNAAQRPVGLALYSLPASVLVAALAWRATAL